MSTNQSGQVDPARVLQVAKSRGLILDPPVVGSLVRFGDLFLLWNQKINLGGRISPVELVDRHFLDAFAAARFINPQDEVVDVGSGGGLPALPLALICPTARISLWEPVGKKVTFLRTAVRELGLGGRVSVRPERMLVPSADSGARPGVAMSRATFAPEEWLAMGRRLVAPDGRVLVFATDEDFPGGGQPQLVERYAPNRRILVFSSD